MSDYILTADGELYHYGVKGMKWGVRKAAQAHEARTAARDKARQEKVKTAVTKYKDAAQAHEARTAARVKGVSRRTQRLEKAVQRQEKVAKSWDDQSAITDKKGRTLMSKAEVKEIRDAAYSKLEKQKVKLIKSQMADQIQAGSSVVGRMYNSLTGAHRTQAEIEYDINKRAKVNKAWRD